MGEIVAYTWRPTDEGGADELHAQGIPPGVYEADFALPVGFPSLSWAKDKRVNHNGTPILLKSFTTTTTERRKWLPDSRIGTLRFEVEPSPASEGDRIEFAVTVGAVVGLAAGAIGIGLVARALVVEVRRLVQVPAVPILGIVAGLFGAGVLVKSLRGG